MLKRSIGAVVLMACCLPAVLSATMLPVQHRVVNGLPVYWVKTTGVPMAKATLLFRVGAANANIPGQTWFALNYMYEGTTHMNADAIARAADRLGAGISVNVHTQFSMINLQCTRDTWEPATRLWQSIIQDANFPADVCPRLQKSHLTEIALRDQNIARYAGYQFRRYLYAGQPYADSPMGNAQSVPRITRDAAAHFYHQQFTKDHAALLVVGEVSDQQVLDLARRMANALPAHGASDLPPPHSAISQNTVHRLPFRSAQTHVFLGALTGVSMKDPDYWPLKIASWILGGNALGSELFKTIREERGLAYSVYSVLQPMPTQSLWLMGLQTKSSQANQAIKLLRDTAKQFIAKGPTRAQVQAAKRYWEGAYPLQFDSNARLMAKLIRLVKMRLPLDYDDQVLARIQQLTPRQIHRAMQQHWHPDHWLMVVVGPQAQTS